MKDICNTFETWSTNYLLDIETSVIVVVEATQAYRVSEVNAARTMIDRTEERLGIRPNGTSEIFRMLYESQK